MLVPSFSQEDPARFYPFCTSLWVLLITLNETLSNFHINVIGGSHLSSFSSCWLLMTSFCPHSKPIFISKDFCAMVQRPSCQSFMFLDFRLYFRNGGRSVKLTVLFKRRSSFMPFKMFFALDSAMFLSQRSSRFGPFSVLSDFLLLKAWSIDVCYIHLANPFVPTWKLENV